MGKEGLAAQDRGAGADTGMIIAKDIVGSIKKDTLFFAGELLTDADPFHCSTSAGRFWFVVTRARQIGLKEYRTMLARAVPKMPARINLLISQGEFKKGRSRQKKKGYGASYKRTGSYQERRLSSVFAGLCLWLWL
jgi:hypothetical protein